MYSFYLIALYIVLLLLKPTRKAAKALWPWLVFACSYDWMRFWPNYEFNPIDVRGIYEAEKDLFGISTATGVLTPNEWCALHTNTMADLIAGISYLCWVPVPLAFALWLFFKGREKDSLRFSMAFLLVNVLGFTGYYIHPASPPWYVMEHGFEPVLGTPGSVAGLIRFDNLIGIPVFQSIYSGNSNVFAAVPSLHSAYVLIAAIYAAVFHCRKWVIALFTAITVGIWWTAVYAGHHYIIDVLLGILTALIAVALLELVLHFVFPRYISLPINHDQGGER